MLGSLKYFNDVEYEILNDKESSTNGNIDYLVNFKILLSTR